MSLSFTVSEIQVYLFTKKLPGVEDFILPKQVYKDFIFEPQNSVAIHWGLHLTKESYATGVPLSEGYFLEVSD